MLVNRTGNTGHFILLLSKKQKRVSAAIAKPDLGIALNPGTLANADKSNLTSGKSKDGCGLLNMPYLNVAAIFNNNFSESLQPSSTRLSNSASKSANVGG